MKTWVILLAALLFMGRMASSEDKTKADHLPETPEELVAWLPNTIWEIHSAIHHRAGEGYLMFRPDGYMTQIDTQGKPVETKIWGVNLNMLVVWGGAYIRIMTFDKTFTTFKDSHYGTMGKRNTDPAILKMFEQVKAPKYLPKESI